MVKTGDYVMIAGNETDALGTTGLDAVIWAFKMNSNDTCTHTKDSGAWQWTGASPAHAFGNNVGQDAMHGLFAGPGPYNAVYSVGSLYTTSASQSEWLMKYWYVP